MSSPHDGAVCESPLAGRCIPGVCLLMEPKREFVISSKLLDVRRRKLTKLSGFFSSLFFVSLSYELGDRLIIKHYSIFPKIRRNFNLRVMINTLIWWRKIIFFLAIVLSLIIVEFLTVHGDTSCCRVCASVVMCMLMHLAFSPPKPAYTATGIGRHIHT